MYGGSPRSRGTCTSAARRPGNGPIYFNPVSTFPQISLLMTWQGLDSQPRLCPKCCNSPARVCPTTSGTSEEEAGLVALFGNDCTEGGRKWGWGRGGEDFVGAGKMVSAGTPSELPLQEHQPQVKTQARLTAQASTTTTEKHRFSLRPAAESGGQRNAGLFTLQQPLV